MCDSNGTVVRSRDTKRSRGRIPSALAGQRPAAWMRKGAALLTQHATRRTGAFIPDHRARLHDGGAHWYPDRRVRVPRQDREQLLVGMESKIFIVVALNDDARLIVIAIDEVQAAGMAGGADANEASVRGGRRRRGGFAPVSDPAGGPPGRRPRATRERPGVFLAGRPAQNARSP